MNPTPSIRGEPLDADAFMDFAEIDISDIESAILWFDENASLEWVGVLDDVL